MSKDSITSKAGRKAKRSTDLSSRERSRDCKPGGQPGYQGSGLTPPAEPDRTRTAEVPGQRRECDADLADPPGASDVGVAWAQVWDILPVVLQKVYWWGAVVSGRAGNYSQPYYLLL